MTPVKPSSENPRVRARDRTRVFDVGSKHANHYTTAPHQKIFYVRHCFDYIYSCDLFNDTSEPLNKKALSSPNVCPIQSTTLQQVALANYLVNELELMGDKV